MKFEMSSNRRGWPESHPKSRRTWPSVTFLTWLLLAGPGSAQVEDYITGTSLNFLGWSNGLLFWKSDCALPGAPSRISQEPSGGGTRNTVFAPSGCSAAEQLRSEVALDQEGWYYWVNAAGGVQRVRSGGVPETLATTPDSSMLMANAQVAMSPGHVFWAESSGELYQNFRIYRAPKTGGTALLVWDSSGAGALTELIALSSQRLILLTEGSQLYQLVQFLDPVGGPWWQSYSIPQTGRGTAVTVRGDRLYWAERSLDGLSTEFRSAPLANLLDQTPHHLLTGLGTHRVDQLAVDGVNLYYQVVAAGNASLHRKPLVGGSAQEIAGPLGYIATYLVTDGRHVFWRKNDTTISRFAIGAAAVTRDIEATGMEVVQAIQSADNYAPLILGKPTIVRLFGRLVFSSDGASQIALGPEALLYGSKDGASLPGSPLSPEPPAPGRRRPIYSTAGSRERLEDGWIFNLPDAWTRLGAIQLNGMLNPSRVVSETGFANNIRALTADFQRRAPICVRIIPLRHRLGTLGAHWDPTLEPMWDRAESLLPTSDLQVFYPGGSPMEELEVCGTFPFVCYGPYELTKSDDESWYILAKLALRNIGTDASAQCAAQNGRTHTAALFATSRDRAFNGMATCNSLISYVEMGRADGDHTGINSVASGVTFAHELGHNYGRCHVRCPPPEDPQTPGWTEGCRDDSYPNPFCSISWPGLFLGYDPISRKLIQVDEAADLMSYSHRLDPAKPRWPSAYTWTAIANELGTMPAGSAARVAQARVAPKGGGGGPTWLLSGLISPSTGQAELLYATLLDAMSAGRALEASAASDCSQYSILAYNAQGAVLAQVPACVAGTSDGGADRHFFLAMIGGLQEAVRVELAPAAHPEQPLAVLPAGINAPTVHLLAPKAGEVIGARMRIEWRGEDPDADPLRYTVRFSRDDGATWQVVVDDTPQTTAEFETRGLPGSAQCRLQVVASDGLHTGEAISDQFTLTRKAPEAVLLFETARGLSGALSEATVAWGDTATLHGRAYDDEDGRLGETAFSWMILSSHPLYPMLLGTGSRYEMRGFPPGTYVIILAAADSDANTATTYGTLTIEPKFIADSNEAIELDGYADDLAYLQDTAPAELRYANGAVAVARMARLNNTLFVSFSGLPIGLDSRQFVAVCADPNGSGDPRPQATDYRFQVYADGEVKTLTGDGTGYSEESTPTGLQARVARSENSWSAELAIDLNRLGGWNGQTARLSVGHYHRNFSGDDTLWPLGAAWDMPGTWTACVLGVNPNDPYDADGDGLPDQWEIAQFGETKRDGSGDFDGDGSRDGDEWIAGTQPTDGLSRLTVQIDREPGAGYRLRWPSAPGRNYTVYRSTDFQVFAPVAIALPATGSETSWVDSEILSGQAFYRVQVQYWR